MHDSDLAVVAEGLGVRYNLRLSRERTLRETVAEALRLRSFSRGSDFWALSDISFSLRSGEILGIVGRNGSGKSTLMLTVAGILRPDSGRLTTFGARASLLTLGAGFEPDQTGRQNIYLTAAYYGQSRSLTAERIEAIIDFAELGAFIDAPIRQYSTGMRARLGFSIAAHTQPDLLLLDETLGVGDAAFQRKCETKIHELVRNARAIMVATHTLAFVRQHCTTALWLDGGRVEALGEAASVADEYEQTLGGTRAPAGSGRR